MNLDDDKFKQWGEAMKDDKETTHESWALVHAHRTSGLSDDLFGSSIDHHSSVRLTISRAKESRSHGYGFYMETQQLIEVEMSAMQWAEMITSMNVGRGAPCTLRRLAGQRIMGQKHDSETSRIKDEFSYRAKEVGAKMLGLVNEVRERLAKSTASKKVQEEVCRMLEQFAQHFWDYQPFMQKLFIEACEGTVTEAKAAVDAFVTHAIVSAGLESLGAEVQKRLMGGKQEDSNAVE